MNAPTAFPDQKPVPPYKHTPLFPLGPDTTPYKKITAEGVRVEKVLGKDMLVVSREALRALSEAAFGDINHYLRPGHLKQLRNILDDKEASDNDKFVAFDFLKNANISAGGVLPMCQDTGTAIIMGKKGCNVITDGDDEAALSEGARDAYLRRNLRYSQVAPLTMYEEKNTANNMPAQCEIYAEGGSSEIELGLQVHVHGQGWRLRQQELSVPGDAVRADQGPPAGVPEGEGANARHRGVPAISPCDRDRRNFRRTVHEDGEAGFRALSRCAADPGLR